MRPRDNDDFLPSPGQQVVPEDDATSLTLMFPALTTFDIKFILNKFEGDLTRATDELLTQSFLEEKGDRLRGIEGFAGCTSPARHPKRERRRKGKTASIGTSKTTTVTSPACKNGSWDEGRKHIEFLAIRCGMPSSQVAALYHEMGASLPQTIRRILAAHIEVDLRADDDTILQNAVQTLRPEFPTISLSHLKALCQITHPNLSDAREIAVALVSHPQPSQRIELTIRHAPLHPTSSSPSPCTEGTDRSARYPAEALLVADRAAHLREARDEAFSKAAAAYRRGKSDHLMGAAAIYYAEEGHAYHSKAQKQLSAAADALVARQSSLNHLDLHGVSVSDAVRITREKVTTWWHELGDTRYGAARREYRVIIGVGRHSEDGKSHIGPAVAKMLMREGWKFEAGRGVLAVTGVTKKK
ncbi:smr domain-containing protein [Blumeria hordei DH14]|uniref:Smr domain-containing protein n=1 Tax=Blumeria graminis f. sp. hordei (strain DH14) TaxID=546991 RepID=N1JCC4_BLUG1|nr:smr domain-containing protein [Blumeria hordei DH14]